jgi:hypothetical protein
MRPPFRLAASIFARLVRARRDALPRASTTEVVAVFEDLQRQAYGEAGWSGVLRYWSREYVSALRLSAQSDTTDQPARRLAPLSGVTRDVRDAWRSLRRAPAFTTKVVAMLAL